MNASSFVTFFQYMLRQNAKRLQEELFATFKLAPDKKKYTTHFSSYSQLLYTKVFLKQISDGSEYERFSLISLINMSTKRCLPSLHLFQNIIKRILH